MSASQLPQRLAVRAFADHQEVGILGLGKRRDDVVQAFHAFEPADEQKVRTAVR